jgi:hypothetical protein
MKIYHFCSAKHVRPILKQGIRTGGVCLLGKDGYDLRVGWQWLTLDQVRENQSWATRNLVKYDRTAYRLTVELPDDSVLYDRDGLEKEIPGSRVLFDGWPGSENWRVYHGWILPEWITGCEKMEG